MSSLRVLVVDDSAVSRRWLTEALRSLPDVSVVGKAADGEQALQLIEHLDPDLITLDLGMPGMDGFSLLRFLMTRKPRPVLVISGRSGKAEVFKALELGALDFVAKGSATSEHELEAVRHELASKIAMIRHLRVAVLPKGRRERSSGNERRPIFDRALPPGTAARHVLALAASTGGPSAIVELFRQFRSDLPVTGVIAQHMPARFTETFAERLDRLGGLRVTEAVDGEALRPGHIVVCPGGFCIELNQTPQGLVTAIRPPTPSEPYAPSADRLFSSASRAVGDRLVALVLSGMGEDGSRGVVDVKARGGRVWVQSPADAVLDGMPRAVTNNVDVDVELPLGQLKEELPKFLEGRL